MQVIDSEDPFSLVDVSSFVVSALPKVADTRGYMYLLVDSVFPEYFKIGRTIDMHKRLQAYNADKPYKTTSVHAISKLFHNATEVESTVIKAMYRVTSPTTFSKEWFLIEHLEQAVKFIEEAEKVFQLEEQTSNAKVHQQTQHRLTNGSVVDPRYV